MSNARSPGRAVRILASVNPGWVIATLGRIPVRIVCPPIKPTIRVVSAIVRAKNESSDSTAEASRTTRLAGDRSIASNTLCSSASHSVLSLPSPNADTGLCKVHCGTEARFVSIPASLSICTCLGPKPSSSRKQNAKNKVASEHRQFAVYVLPGLAFTPIDVGGSECQASGIVLVARFACARADHGCVVAYEGLLRILS